MFHRISSSNIACKKYEEKGWVEELYGGGRRTGTKWVEGNKRSGGKFDQNKVGRSNQAIREQVIQQKTRDWVGGSKLAIREWVIGYWVLQSEHLGLQGIGVRLIGERENLGTRDQEVIKINNTVRNEWELFLFNTSPTCHETLYTYVENRLDRRKMDTDIP